MVKWGLPERIRMDNGMPWATQSTLPSALALWLVGLGILPVYSRPARSTDNAIVERSHGVLAKWVAPAQRHHFNDCQQQLAWAVNTQIHRYRCAGGQTRAQRYPSLFANPRRYMLEQESEIWSMQAIVDYLSQFHFQRKVEKAGQITLFANTYGVGRAYARQTVEITLDVDSQEWVIHSEFGQEIRRHPNRELTYETIAQLRLAKRRRGDKTS